MSLAKRYRTRFGAPRGDRLLFYVTMALAVHAGMATAGWMSWQEHRTPPAETADRAPIEFVYLDTPAPVAASDNETAPIAQQDAAAAGTRVKNLPVNAGKVVTAAKRTAAGKPVESAAPIVQMQPTQDAPLGATITPATSPITADSATSPETDAAKAVEPAPAPLPLAESLADSIPELPATDPEVTDGQTFSEAEAVNPADAVGAIAATPNTTAPEAPVPTDEPVVGEPLPPPPLLPEDTSDTGDSGTDAETYPAEESDSLNDAVDSQAPVEAERGLDGLPNPNRTVSDAAPQIAARRDQDLGDYVNALIAEIEAVWTRIEVQNSYSPVVRFAISREGELQSVTLIEPSGSASADQTAVDAVQTATPFEPFPETITDAALTIRLEFNYIVNPETQEAGIAAPTSEAPEAAAPAQNTSDEQPELQPTPAPSASDD